MRGKKDRNSRVAVVKSLIQANELKDLRVAQPVEADPGGARATPNCVPGQFSGNPVRFGDKDFVRRGSGTVRTQRGAFLRFGGDCFCRRYSRAGVLPDDFDLPGDFFFVEMS